jgi:hypothetical protein
MHQIGHKVALLVMPAVSAPQILLSKNMARLNPRPLSDHGWAAETPLTPCLISLFLIATQEHWSFCSCHRCCVQGKRKQSVSISSITKSI